MSADRDHPIRLLLDDAARGQEPIPEELDALRLRDGVDRSAVVKRIKTAARNCVALHADGMNGRAREHAAERAQELIAEVGPLLRKPRPALPTDPRELVAEMERRGYDRSQRARR